MMERIIQTAHLTIGRTIAALIFLILIAVQGYADVTIEPIDKLVLEGAKEELAKGTLYNTDMLETYFGTKYLNGIKQNRNIYPNGDVKPTEGVCTDLVVRACRKAGVDLQKLVHEDIISDKKAYSITAPDKYIDHRRVWVLLKYFKRKCKVLTADISKGPEFWKPGDIVMLDIGSKQHFHIGIVSDSLTDEKKRPLAIHNMASWPGIFPGKTCEQDILNGVRIKGTKLLDWKIIGHYRLSETK